VVLLRASQASTKHLLPGCLLNMEPGMPALRNDLPPRASMNETTEQTNELGAPTMVLPFEPIEARELTWIPLAVRFKLDRCGVRISLGQWQALSVTERGALLLAPEGRMFERLLDGISGAAGTASQDRRGEKAAGAESSRRHLSPRRLNAHEGFRPAPRRRSRRSTRPDSRPGRLSRDPALRKNC
jgi:hypothetical protein